MNHILSRIVFAIMLKVVHCSNFDMQSYHLDNFLVENPEIVTTNNSDNQEIAGLSIHTNNSGDHEMAGSSIHTNEPGNTCYRTMNLLQTYMQTQEYIFNQKVQYSVTLEKLSVIINFSWCECNQNRLDKITTILSKRDCIRISEHFDKLCKLLSSFGEFNKKIRRTNNEQNIPKRRTNNILQEYKKVTRYNTIDEYVAQMKRDCCIASPLRVIDKYRSIPKKFFDLIADITYLDKYSNLDYANELNIKEIRAVFYELKRINSRKFSEYYRKCYLDNNLTNLFYNSLLVFFETRFRVKYVVLPEFICLNDSFMKYSHLSSRTSCHHKVFLIYLVSRIEIAVSKMAALNDQTTTLSNAGCPSTTDFLFYRCFVREVLLTNLMLVFQVPNRYVCKYILLSQLEYVYINLRWYSLIYSFGHKNFYDVFFWILSNSCLKFLITKQCRSESWCSNTGLNLIKSNFIILRIVSYQPCTFKRALQKSVRNIFNRKISKSSKLSKLKRTICVHIDKLDETNPSLMIIKAHAIYQFVINRLLNDPYQIESSYNMAE